MSINKLKIFVSAFSCMPYVGSEPGVGWHWIMEMSKYFELWVLVHKEQTVDIEKYVKENEIDKVIHFIYYNIPFNSLFFKNGKFRWVRTYNILWTNLANKIVKKTMKENGIEIFHNLTFGNAIWPVSRYGQKQFFIWGPIGGIETIPVEYSRLYNLKNRLIESVRRLVVSVLQWMPGFNRKCKNANLILCKTEAMYNFIPNKYRSKAILFTDVAVEYKQDISNIENRKNSKIEYISVGRFDVWRGFDLIIEAFSLSVKENKNIHLSIIGDGMDRSRLQKLISDLDLSDYVTLTGSVSIEKYNYLLENCDVVINGCLKEGAVTVSFDSVSYGKSLICIDSGGFTQFFSDDSAIVLPRTKSRSDLITLMKKAIIKLTDIDCREQMVKKAQEKMPLFTWEKKGLAIKDIINQHYNKI